jgi:acyl-CoA thioesterase
MFSGYIDPNPTHQRWFKARESVHSDDPKIHAGIIAYASDAGTLWLENDALTNQLYLP